MVDKNLFYDIEGTTPVESNDAQHPATEHSEAQETTVDAPPFAIKNTQGENNMADVDTALLASTIGASEANIRDKVGAEACMINKNIGDTGHRLEKSVGDVRYTVANEAGALSKQIGKEACDINTHIADVRQEDAENFGHTRRDIQSSSADIRREQANGFAETRFNLAERAGDIRREGAEHTNEIIKEGLKGDYGTLSALKDVRFDLSSDIGNNADRIVDRVTEGTRDIKDRFFTVGRDLADLRQAQLTTSKDIELNALKTQLDAKENTRYIADKIVADGEKTRALINDLKYHDLNRGLVERNTELVNCEQDRRHYHDRWHDGRWDQFQTQFAGQWAQLQSQVQAFQSQLQETRQGMVNFGTMAGVGQSSTSNNVR